MCRITKGKFYMVSIICQFARDPAANDPMEVSQSTLRGTATKANKRDLHGAGPADKANALYGYFSSKIGELYGVQVVQNSVFQAKMDWLILGSTRGFKLR